MVFLLFGRLIQRNYVSAVSYTGRFISRWQASFGVSVVIVLCNAISVVKNLWRFLQSWADVLGSDCCTFFLTRALYCLVSCRPELSIDILVGCCVNMRMCTDFSIFERVTGSSNLPITIVMAVYQVSWHKSLLSGMQGTSSDIFSALRNAASSNTVLGLACMLAFFFPLPKDLILVTD